MWNLTELGNVWYFSTSIGNPTHFYCKFWCRYIFARLSNLGECDIIFSLINKSCCRNTYHIIIQTLRCVRDSFFTIDFLRPKHFPIFAIMTFSVFWCQNFFFKITIFFTIYCPGKKKVVSPFWQKIKNAVMCSYSIFSLQPV